MFFDSGTNFTKMRADIEGSRWRAMVKEADQPAQELKSVYAQYKENMEVMAKFISSNLETFKIALNEAAQFVMKETKPGFFFNTEHDYARKFQTQLRKSQNLDEIIIALDFVRANADSFLREGLIGTINSYAISQCNPAKAELIVLLKILEKKNPYYFLLDIIYQLKEVSAQYKTRQEVIAAISGNQTNQEYSPIAEIVMSYR